MQQAAKRGASISSRHSRAARMAWMQCKRRTLHDGYEIEADLYKKNLKMMEGQHRCGAKND